MIARWAEKDLSRICNCSKSHEAGRAASFSLDLTIEPFVEHYRKMRFRTAWFLFAVGSPILQPLLAAEDPVPIAPSPIDDENNANEKDVDLVVIAYNSRDEVSDSLVYSSIEENMEEESKANVKFINVGTGKHLWQLDNEGPEHMRGWMFRLRLTMSEVVEEYKRREGKDFIVLVADAEDVFVAKSPDGNGLDLLKHRFLTDFADHKIVFSSQVYCCNPWELRSVARRDWDKLYVSSAEGSPPSIFKHINAGLFMGYASAIREMADEMKLWDKSYHQHDSYHSLMDTQAGQLLHMRDIEVDDDEWQISAWYMEDQSKSQSLATLDFHQELFVITHPFRAQQRDGGWIVFSRQFFRNMFGSFPQTSVDLEEITFCTYEYEPESKRWINLITGTSPLLFHFAGNDWLCACQVFQTEGYKNINNKFREKCTQGNFDEWQHRVKEGIQDVSSRISTDPMEFIFLFDDANKSRLTLHNRDELTDDDRRRLHLSNEAADRMLQEGDPYESGGDITFIEFIASIPGFIVSVISSISSAIFFWL